jgi:N-hydroxyarylamine O-acetyltransferase
MSRPELEAYFARIGYSGSTAPTLRTLQSLHLDHAQAIPFENLDSLTGRPVPLDLPSLENKLIHRRRGGYCFEQNLLFAHVLRTLGFQVTGLSARVLWNAPEGTVRARNHMLLRVELDDGTYIADVGFGGLTLTAPLRLASDVTQATPHEPFRLLFEEGHYLLQSLVRDEWKPLYRFDLQAQLPVDYDASNWWISTHPQSQFVNNLVVARPVPGKRFGLFNARLTVHQLDGRSEERRSEERALGSLEDIRAVLQAHFGIELPHDLTLDPAILTR